MLLLNSYIPLLLWTRTSAQWLKPRSTEQEHSHTLQQLSNLPNPYPMPDSPYSINFQDPGPFLGPQSEVETFLGHTFTKVVNHIHRYGDGPLPLLFDNVYGCQIYEGPYGFSVRTPANGLTYNDTTHILAAMTLKSRLEGYRERVGDVVETVTGDFQGATALARNELESGSLNKTSQLDPIPNPFVLSDSDLSIDFEEQMSDLVPNDVVDCIVSARRRITRRISQHGEGRVTIPSIWFVWRSVEFRVFAEQVPRRVTLNDTLNILDAFAIKSGREGFQSRWATIIITQGGQIVAQAVLGHSQPVAGESGNRTTSLESSRRARRRISA